MNQQCTDQALAARLLDGDEAAFDEFFNLMFPRVYRFAFARIGQSEDAAEEIAQATLCQVVRRLETWRGEASLFTWICTICRHEIGVWLRAHPSEATLELAEDVPEIRAALESWYVRDLPGTDAVIQQRHVAVLVQRVLDHLPVRYGDVLEWKYLDDVSVREIAGRLDLTEKAAESLLTRARAAFRDLAASLAPELMPHRNSGPRGACP